MKKIASISILILCLIIIVNLVHSIYSLWNKQDLLSRAHAQLETEKKEQENLKKQLSIVKKNDFVEKEARNKLFLAKPNESEILMPDEVQKATSSAKNLATPNWQKWISLFFGG